MNGPVFKKRRGSVLVVTLLIIMSLAGLTLDLSDQSGLSLTLCGFSRDSFLAGQAARAGVQAAMERLASDPDMEVDSLNEPWAVFGSIPLPDGLPEGMEVHGRIVDESGKLNLNTLLNEKGEIDEKMQARLIRLFRALDIGEEKAAPVLDWLDADDIERMNGAESYYYQDLQSPYVCSNGPFMTVGQIRLVKGLGESLTGKDLRDYLTVHTDGKVNINTASPEVLQSLSDKFDSRVADAVVEYRKTMVFMKPEDLRTIPGMDDAVFSGVSNWVTVKSSAFFIEMEGSYSGVSSVVRAVAHRENNATKPIYWRVE
ncbi:MAG: general secretion pathway protein GspK [Desulfobacteraceae bacterium]|nr:MAG: general secretion pathway protein GspK [Desulfobacteraceae bacterium]